MSDVDFAANLKRKPARAATEEDSAGPVVIGVAPMPSAVPVGAIMPAAHEMGPVEEARPGLTLGRLVGCELPLELRCPLTDESEEDVTLGWLRGEETRTVDEELKLGLLDDDRV